jgi:hypothetical protein
MKNIIGNDIRYDDWSYDYNAKAQLQTIPAREQRCICKQFVNIWQDQGGQYTAMFSQHSGFYEHIYMYFDHGY